MMWLGTIIHEKAGKLDDCSFFFFYFFYRDSYKTIASELNTDVLFEIHITSQHFASNVWELMDHNVVAITLITENVPETISLLAI